MGLTIKNAETVRLVRELASLTGESLTVAAAESVRERLDRVWRERDDGMAARLKEPFRSVDHGDWLHDERGIPR